MSDETAADPYQCEHCGEWLPDQGLAFLEHIAASETCHFLWAHGVENSKREAGGT